MNVWQRRRAYFLFGVLMAMAGSCPQLRGQAGAAKAAEQDGSHDFDFEIGTWKTHLKKLVHPLTGSTTWAEYDGITVVRKIWDGRANLVELQVDGQPGHIEALSLRLYNPQSQQWSLNFANSNDGSVSTPTIGGFKDGRGEFYDQEMLNGRAIFVRFVISRINPNSVRFEQSFSDDGGKSWEVNWIATDARIADKQATAAATAAHEATPGQHGFDFELGSWKIHLKRLENPLTGGSKWVEFDGTSVTHRVWEGRADIEEFLVDSPSGHIEGVTLRLYNRQARQWNIYWATSKAGVLGQPPTIGEFKDGRGEFYDQEPYHGRAILVRYVWSDMTPHSAHFEQSFSDDGGKTWEVNWITDQTRISDDSSQAQ